MKFLITAVTVLTLHSIIHAQNRGWRKYSSVGGRFSIELPAPMRKVASFEAEGRASLDPNQKNRWASCYAAFETTPEESRFGIIVVGQHGRRLMLRKMKANELYSYLSLLLMTDDDRETKPKRETQIKANGLIGREYFYAIITSRGRIFDTGREIYVLVFVGRDEDDLMSQDAEGFLNSFKLRLGGRAFPQGVRQSR